MAKKRKTTKQQAWAVVDRETGEIVGAAGMLTHVSRRVAREMRHLLPDTHAYKVSRVTITIHH